MKAMFCHLFSVCLLSLSAAPASAAIIGFTGPFDVSNWATVNQSTNGFFDTSGAPNSVVIYGGNDGSGQQGFTSFSVVNPYPYKIQITFDWSYTTADFSSFWDPFWVVTYFFGGNWTKITDDLGPASQSGSAKFGLLPLNVFSFRIETLDNYFGRGQVSISNFAAVPEPTSMAVFGTALAGLAIRRRWRTTAAV